MRMISFFISDSNNTKTQTLKSGLRFVKGCGKSISVVSNVLYCDTLEVWQVNCGNAAIHLAAPYGKLLYYISEK